MLSNMDSANCVGGICSLPPRNPRGLICRRFMHLLSIFLKVFVLLVLLDLSLSRLRYHYNLSWTLTPIKREIQLETYTYHGEVSDELKHCHAFDRASGQFVHNCTLSACEQNALMLSERRQSILNLVRSSHPTSRVVSEWFDGARGLAQSSKIEKLFSRKTCEGVIASVDKTNMIIDILALVMFMVSLGLLWSLSFRMTRGKLD